MKIGEHDIELKAYLTERENRELVKVLSGSFAIGDDGKVSAKDADTNTVLAYQDKLVEIWVASADGKTDDLANVLLDWDKDDYKKVITAITDMSNDEQKKTK